MTPKLNKPSRPEEWSPPLILVAGVGMGPDDLSMRAMRWIDRAEVLFGGKRHLEGFPHHPGTKIPLEKSLEESLKELDAVSRNHRTLVLASGDPFYYGIGRRLVQTLGKDRLHVLPNVTTVQALFARLCIPWDDVRVFSLHGREASPRTMEWISIVAAGGRVALFTDGRHTPAWVAERLLEADLGRCEMVVGEDLGLTGETIRGFSPHEALRNSFSPLNLCVILPSSDAGGATNTIPASGVPDDARLGPVFGLDESDFAHQAGLITKLEVRAVVLAHLRLRPNLVLWDIGAGSGSVSIEASRLVPLSRVVAIEKDVERFHQLAENAHRLGSGNIQALSGNALELLAELPRPDRVFIGGSGGELGGILPQVADRLRPGGRVVQTAVTLDTLETMRSFWRDRGWKLDLVQLQVSRSVGIGRSHRFEALNPVFVITAVDPHA
jgi:precorrin-6Y C5,15-methyltransferase (decarboxylating)